MGLMKWLIDEFSVAIRRMGVLDNESQKLTQRRDWPLPLLMNGRVTMSR